MCDWLVPAGETAAARALQLWLAERAEEDGAEHVTGILPEFCPAFLDFQAAGFRVHPTGYYTVGRCYHGPYGMLWLHCNWYYTLGDYDLC